MDQVTSSSSSSKSTTRLLFSLGKRVPTLGSATAIGRGAQQGAQALGLPISSRPIVQVQRGGGRCSVEQQNALEEKRCELTSRRCEGLAQSGFRPTSIRPSCSCGPKDEANDITIDRAGTRECQQMLQKNCKVPKRGEI
jgi:hypothetical protein